MSKRKYKYNPLYKNFLSLKVNPLNNNKFLKFEFKIIKYKKVKDPLNKQFKEVPVWGWVLRNDSKKKKWKEFLETQIKTQKFFNRFKPQTIYYYKTSKFASQGNSLKKKFKTNLLAKATFSYLYGGLSKKYLKEKMTKIYSTKKVENPIRICTEFFESRLDSILYKAKFCKSVRNAQQLISHKHVKVNNVIERNKAYIVKKGDLITLTPKSLQFIRTDLNKNFEKSLDSIIWPLPPTYLNINYKTLEIIVGDAKNYNFSNSFTLKPDTYSVITNSYRN